MSSRTTELQLHPLCTLFPRLTGAEFDALRDDIAANGLRQPIITHEGMILDGGNRYRACLAAGIKPAFRPFDGANLVSFVLSANLHRRHLSAGQQAAIVASAQDWAKANVQGQNKVTGNVAGDTIADRAKQSGASERTQRMADKVAREAPELAQKVAHGEISLPKAAKQIEPHKPEVRHQQPAAAKPHDGAGSGAHEAAKSPDSAPAAQRQRGPLSTEEARHFENMLERLVSSTGDAPLIDTDRSLLEQLAELREQLEESRQNAADLADMADGLRTATAGEQAAAKEIAKLHGQMRTVESQRDQYMTTCNELKKQVKALRKENEKLQKKLEGKA